MISKQLPAALAVALCSMIFIALDSPEVAAQRGGRGGMMGNSSMSLLSDTKVTKELELDEGQVEALQELKGDMQSVYRDTFDGMRERFREPGVDREAVMTEMREAIKDKMKTVDKKLGEVLLPHQMSRLSELTYQMQAKRSGGTRGLLENEKVKEELGITDEQIEQVEAKADEVNKKLEEKITQARRDAQDEILSVLTSEQQAKIKEMIGEPFAFEESEGRFAGRGGREGGRGGRGGRDGGPRGGRDGGPRGGRDGGGGGRDGGGRRGGRGGEGGL